LGIYAVGIFGTMLLKKAFVWFILIASKILKGKRKICPSKCNCEERENERNIP
jgi:hypothetical protein